MLRRERRSLSALACVVALGCAGQRGSTREPLAQERCVLRISERGTFADGEPMSRADAVAHCKRAPGGAVVVTETTNEAIELELSATKSALEREGIRIYIGGPICYEPERLGCRPRTPAGPIHPKREILPKREIVGPPTR